MVLDPVSPVAPARVRMLLLPIGRIKRARFLGFIERLQSEHVVRLGDVSPDGRPNRNMFSPLAFPAGMIVYDLTTSLPPPSHLSLSPFEIYREPLGILAIADGAELESIPSRENGAPYINDKGSNIVDLHLRGLEQELEILRDQYPKSLVHHLLIFDYKHQPQSSQLSEGIVGVPSVEQSKITTMKTIMCDMTSLLLAEMTTLAKSIQGMSSIESPNQGQGVRTSNGYSWPTGNDNPSRASSQVFSESGSQSPPGKRDRSIVRMSMPAQLRSMASDSLPSSPSSRPTTPMMEQPPAPDGRPGSMTPTTKNVENSQVSRVSETERFRDRSHDRISIQGFGSGSLSERSRTKGKGRTSIVIGSMYLQAGRWTDALRELVEGAIIAQSNNDHIWHAKALDHVLVAMLMLAWAGLDFQIPQICYSSLEKAPYHTPASVAMENSSQATSRLASLQNLSVLLPEFLDKILNRYTRITGESLPQVPFSESVIRFSKILTLIHLGGGKIDDHALSLVVQGTPFRKAEVPRPNIYPTKSDIAKYLFRAFPSAASAENLAPVDRTIILGGIASVLDSLGYYRKKAMVMRELVSILIPGLIQARKIGAAEIGIHPAAGLAALNLINGNSNVAGAFELGEGDIENGVDELLGLMCCIYGTVYFEASPSNIALPDGNKGFDDSDTATAARILRNARLRTFGGQNIKTNVLRACINFAEALPDFKGVLQFSSDLLRTIGSGVAPGPRSDDVSPSMNREDQVRLAMNITRTINAARTLGLHSVEAEYWDEFLVRGVELEAPPPPRTPIPHERTELSGSATVAGGKERNPFIYNPFVQRPDTLAVEHLLVAEESAIFKVTLQNPYEFDVEIESIKLECDKEGFVSAAQNTLIGPYRTQIMTISGTPKSAGSLNIRGCIVKVRGCRERRFPIYEEPWAPQSETKIKAVGLESLVKSPSCPRSVESISQLSGEGEPPLPISLPLKVIEKQPVVIVKSSTSSQSAVMILEGERQTFSITLQNLSKTIPADLLLFSFQDSTQAPLQTLLGNRDASSIELYEYELILSRKQALRWIKRKEDVPYIEPGRSATFLFEILGKPGLTGGVVQVDYAYVGMPVDDIQQRFYTRQVTHPLTMTVNASVELARMDILPLTGEVPGNLWPKTSMEQVDFSSIKSDNYCLLMLDLRNVWPSQLQVHLEIAGGHSIDEEIVPGTTSRIVFPIRRLLLQNPFAPIPALDPTRQRQFIVSAGKVSADTERTTREAFWYREEILKALSGTWKTVSSPTRRGDIELRGLRFSSRMVEALRTEDISIEVMVDRGDSNQPTDQTYRASVNEFIGIKSRIHNRLAHILQPILRLQPSIRNHAQHSSLDISKKLVWDGTLQCTLPVLAANETAEVIIGMTALCRGDFEVHASIEEARLRVSSETDGEQKPGEFETSVIDARERRIWHTRKPCILVIRDVECSDDDM